MNVCPVFLLALFYFQLPKNIGSIFTFQGENPWCPDEKFLSNFWNADFFCYQNTKIEMFLKKKNKSSQQKI